MAQEKKAKAAAEEKKPKAHAQEEKVKVAADEAKPKATAGEKKPKTMLIDAQGLVLGRAATHIAKALLSDLSQRVVVINADKAIITGSRRAIEQKYKERTRRGSERAGPYFPKRPERIFKRAVRGMLPFKQPRGQEAIRRLRCYNGVPDKFAGAKAQKIEEASHVRTAKHITLSQIAQSVGGWKPLDQ